MLDLKKIKAFTSPKVTKKYFIAGEFQEVELSVIPDSVMVELSEGDSDNITNEEKITKLKKALACILNIAEDDAMAIIDCDFTTALDIFNDGQALTGEWAKKRSEEREKAEKNLKAAQMNIQG